MFSTTQYLDDYCKTKNSRFIIFKNYEIEYLINGFVEKKIILKDIVKINQTFSIKYKTYKSVSFSKIALFFIITTITIALIYGFYKSHTITLIILFLGIFSFFMPKLFFYLHNGGNFKKYKIFDGLLVYDDNDFINILPKNEEERLEIKKYFLLKTGKDISKLNKALWII